MTNDTEYLHLGAHLMSLNLLAVSEHSASQQTAMQPTSAVWRQGSSVTEVQSCPSVRQPTNAEMPGT